MSTKHRSTWILFRLLLISVILTASLPLSVASSVSPAQINALTPGWDYTQVGTNLTGLDSASIAFSPQGTPFVAYTNDAGLTIVYFDGSIWQNRYHIDGNYQYVSIQVDSNEDPHVSFMDMSTNVLYYSVHHNHEWISTSVTAAGENSGYFSSIELADDGTPHIAYYSHSTHTIMHAWRDGGIWTSEPIEDVGSTRRVNYIDLGLDSNAYPRAAYCSGAAINSCIELHYAEYSNTKGWANEILDTRLGSGYYVSLDIGLNDYTHISQYVKNTGLSYFHQTSGDWASEQLTGSNIGYYTSLALDSNNSPHIAYLDNNTASVYYTFWDGSAWQTAPIAAATTYSTPISLALSPAANFPQIVYHQTADNTLISAAYQDLPDIAATQIWTTADSGAFRAAFRNDGSGIFNGEIASTLEVDGTELDSSVDSLSILPGEAVVVDYSATWTCSGTSDTILVCADMGLTSEYNHNNNCLQEVWNCDTTPPVITSGPAYTASSTTITTTWRTDEAATTEVFFTQAQNSLWDSIVVPGTPTSHTATISGLTPHTSYYVYVKTTNAIGLTTLSRPTLMVTESEDAPPPVAPVFSFSPVTTRGNNYSLRAQYPDVSNIDHVNFLVDGEIIGTDYSADNGMFQMELNPARRFGSSQEFFSPHNVVLEAVTFAGQPYANPFAFEPQRDSAPMDVQILTPTPDYEFMVPNGTTMPSGSQVTVDVFAAWYEWECVWNDGAGSDGGIPVNCGDAIRDMEGVKLYLDQEYIGDMTPSAAAHHFEYTLDLGGKAPGTYSLSVIASSGNANNDRKSTAQDFKILLGIPNLEVSRTVSREGNVFHVVFTAVNSADADGDITINYLKESMVGLYPVTGVLNGNAITSQYDSNTRNASVTITPPGPIILTPGGSVQFSYDAIPILEKNPQNTYYSIGNDSTRFNVIETGSTKNRYFGLPVFQVTDPAGPGGTLSLAGSVAKAFKSSDYILVTIPKRITNGTAEERYNLLGDMAKLASLKQGVLGFLPDEANIEYTLNDLLSDGSVWASRMNINFSTRGKGYVLLVGETEIIPSFTAGPFDVSWNKENQYAPNSDNRYAHVDGNGAPDLLLGRVIGNTIGELDQVLQTSINVHLGTPGYSFDKSNASVTSGVGIGENDMQYAADRVKITLEADGYTVDLNHMENDAFLWSFDFPFMEHDGFASANIGATADEEIILASRETDQIYVLRQDGTLMTTFGFPAAANGFEEGDALTAGDVDNDGIGEIVHGDRGDVIRIFDHTGAVEYSFNQNFAAWEKLAVGDVWAAHPGNEIVMADDNDYLRIFDEEGNELNTIDIGAIEIGTTGSYYDFADFDQLDIGEMGGSGSTEEIAFTDRTHDVITVISGTGEILYRLFRDFDEGDHMAVGNASNTWTGDEIVIADRSNSIFLYSAFGTNESEKEIYADFEEYDGLTARKMSNGTYQIVQADRGDRIRAADALYPDHATEAIVDSFVNTDLVWIFGHGNHGTTLSSGLQNNDFPVDFGNANPVVVLLSCLVGDFEEGNTDGDTSMPEKFFQSKAGLVFGSTEVSANDSNANAGRKFFRSYWEPGETFAESMQDFKQDRFDVYQYYKFWRLWVSEYNIYGDPKFDVFTSFLERAPAQINAVPPTWTINLPELEMDTLNGFDLAEIPGGDLYQDLNQYQVPIYTLTLDVPAGTIIRDVVLTSQDNLTTLEGLNLPVFTGEISGVSSSSISRPKLFSIQANHDWTPSFEQPFEWKVDTERDGSGTLILTLFPFNYDGAAQYAEYYRDFEFQIVSSSSDINIASLHTDRDAYSAGDTVQLDLHLENTGDPAEVYVDAAIQSLATGQIVSGFSIQHIPSLDQFADLTLDWDTAGSPLGDYMIEVNVFNSESELLTSQTASFTLGQYGGTITQFSAAPTLFTPGDAILIDFSYTNDGDYPLDADAVLEIIRPDGVVVKTLTRSTAGLAAGETWDQTISWNTTGVSEKRYTLRLSVKNGIGTTPYETIEITTQKWLYLPMINR